MTRSMLSRLLDTGPVGIVRLLAITFSCGVLHYWGFVIALPGNITFFVETGFFYTISSAIGRELGYYWNVDSVDNRCNFDAN